jgi:hypothetical protein
VNRVILTHDKTLVRGDVLIDDKPGITGNMIPAWKHLVFDSPTTAPSRKLLGFGSGRTGKLPSIPSWRWPLLEGSPRSHPGSRIGRCGFCHVRCRPLGNSKWPPFGSHVITLVSGGRYRSSGYHMR